MAKKLKVYALDKALTKVFQASPKPRFIQNEPLLRVKKTGKVPELTIYTPNCCKRWRVAANRHKEFIFICDIAALKKGCDYPNDSRIEPKIELPTLEHKVEKTKADARLNLTDQYFLTIDIQELNKQKNRTNNRNKS